MNHDVIVVGGAAMGSATAYYLSQMAPSLDVVVVERDPTYAKASTVLSDGNVRIQFNLEENIRISQYAFEVLESFADDMAVGDYRPEVGARHQGNLFLADEGSQPAALNGLNEQQRLGCDVEWLSRSDVVARWPVIDGPHYTGGTFGRLDGSVDPSAVLQGYRRKAGALGVAFRQATVRHLLVADGRARGVELTDGEQLTAPVVVVCAGAWSPSLLSPVGVEIPVQPVMRSVFVVATSLEPVDSMPSVFLPSGLYMLPESDGTFLMAWSQEHDPVGFDFSVRRSEFYDRIWPELVEQFPAFDQLEVVRSWAGLYAVNTLDGNAILGEWPSIGGLHLCTGFSGHGFQQCHAVGRYLAESILERAHALDLGRFGTERIVRGEPLFEHAGRII